jgi:DNA-binding MarR family transcriptional regulator
MEKILLEFIESLDLAFKKMQEELGDRAGVSRLTLNQFQYIDAIHSLGEPTITEIADKLRITKASVTGGVNKLASMGYVVKTQSSEDKRVFHVSLTEAGQRLVRAKVQAIREYGAFIRAALREDEAQQFEATLTKLVQVFKQS